MEKIFKIYFRIWPTRYFLAKHKEFGYICVVKKVWAPHLEWPYEFKEL